MPDHTPRVLCGGIRRPFVVHPAEIRRTRVRFDVGPEVFFLSVCVAFVRIRVRIRVRVRVCVSVRVCVCVCVDGGLVDTPVLLHVQI